MEFMNVRSLRLFSTLQIARELSKKKYLFPVSFKNREEIVKTKLCLLAAILILEVIFTTEHKKVFVLKNDF